MGLKLAGHGHTINGLLFATLNYTYHLIIFHLDHPLHITISRCSDTDEVQMLVGSIQISWIAQNTIHFIENS